jgi:hypothetical protein
MNAYLKAAEVIALSNKFSCLQIVSSGGTRKQANRYANLFVPDGRGVDLAWLGSVVRNDGTWMRAPIAARDRQKFRVLALCLMAAIVSYRRKRK